MIDLFILQGLSYSGAESFLLESGYTAMEEMTEPCDECDILYISPFILLDESEQVIDKIGYFEFCMYDEDGDPIDYKRYWKRF